MRTKMILLGAVAALSLSSAAPSPGSAPPLQGPQQEEELQKFMRAKLDYSQRVLEGLTFADFNLIAQNAAELRRLSEAAQWKVSPDMQYIRYSNEFQRLAEELEAEARAENIDGATLNYVNMTINCVNCHKFVRGLKVAQAKPRSRG